MGAPSSQATAGKDYMLGLPGISAPMGYFDPAVSFSCAHHPPCALQSTRIGPSLPPSALASLRRRSCQNLSPLPPPLLWHPTQGFSESATFTVSEAKRFREAELTHGRVAMLATLGWLVAEEWHPLFGGNIGGPAFRHFQEVEDVFPQFWELVLFAIGLTEAYRISVGYNDPRQIEQIKADYVPGGEQAPGHTQTRELPSKTLCPGAQLLLVLSSRGLDPTDAPPPSPTTTTTPTLFPQTCPSTPWACSPPTTRRPRTT
jgi:hypothetical protein